MFTICFELQVTNKITSQQKIRAYSENPVFISMSSSSV